MKKFLPYILTLVVIVNLLTPFSVVWKDNQLPKITKNETKASGIVVRGGKETITSTDTTIIVSITAVFPTSFDQLDTERADIFLKKHGNTEATASTLELTDGFKVVSGQVNTKSGTVVFENLTPNTEYDVWYQVTQADRSIWSITKSYSGVAWLFGWNGATVETVRNPNQDYYTLSTSTDSTQSGQTVDTRTTGNADGILPGCEILGIGDDNGSFVGCFAQLFYYAIFVPTSFLFAWAGIFFDWTFAYSISDIAYRTAFVNEGWAIVRDICNIFFIFVLLYAAFKAIFGSHEAKSIVVNVIIIGLLINFSLLATRIMIDASNILARLFYTSQAIEIKTSESSGKIEKAGVNLAQDSGLGELGMSAAIVSKINPQDIIIEAWKVNVQDDAISNKGTGVNSSVSVSTFFLVTLMAVIINVVGFFVFLSVGLIFVARVIGLWMAMVLAPFAFFSYTVPSLSKTKMLGWKSWWSDTIGLCFVAPIFMFFMYLILLFLDGAFGGLIKEQNGANWVLVTIIPFVFIIILLLQAKSFAKKFSGELGQMITGAVTAVGAAALGGAALSAAFVGRKTIGAAMSRASRGETATQKYESGKAKGLGKVTGFIGSKIGMGRVFGNTYDIKTKTVSNGIGGILNKKQRSVGDVDHARSDMDKAKEAAHLKGVDDSRLSGENVQSIKKEFNKMKKGDVESAVRKGDDMKGNKVGESEDEFKSRIRKSEVAKAKATRGNLVIDKKTGKPTGELTDEAKKSVENTINAEFNTKLKADTTKMLDGLFEHTKHEAKGYDSQGKKVTQFDRVVSKSNTGSYDVRNLSDSKSDKRAGILTKMSVAAIAGIALGVRTGLKGMVDVNHGKGQGDFLKDLSHTITEAMKSAKIKVDVGGGGHGGGHDDHGGGHDDHGGGHH